MPPNASEPASGSVIAQHAIFANVISSGSQRSCCASVPRLAMVAAPRPRLTPTLLSQPLRTPDSSETTLPAIASCPPSSPRPPPEPRSRAVLPVCSPDSVARCLSSIVLTASPAITSRPNSLNSLRTIGYGDSSPLSIASWCGRTSLSMKSRTVSRMITSVSDHSNIGFSFIVLRQPPRDVVDLPDPIGLDGLGVMPAAQRRDGAALHRVHLAGDRAFVGRQVRDQRRDVGRAEQVDLALLRFGHQRPHAGSRQG